VGALEALQGLGDAVGMFPGVLNLVDQGLAVFAEINGEIPLVARDGDG